MVSEFGAEGVVLGVMRFVRSRLWQTISPPTTTTILILLLILLLLLLEF